MEDLIPQTPNDITWFWGFLIVGFALVTVLWFLVKQFISRTDKLLERLETNQNAMRLMLEAHDVEIDRNKEDIQTLFKKR